MNTNINNSSGDIDKIQESINKEETNKTTGIVSTDIIYMHDPLNLAKEEIKDNKGNVTRLAKSTIRDIINGTTSPTGYSQVISDAKQETTLDDVKRPPENCNSLADFYSVCPFHSASINIKVECAVGLGYTLNENSEETKDKMDKVREFLNKPNPNYTSNIQSIMENKLKDLSLYGNDYTEVRKSGDSFAIYNTPGKNMVLTADPVTGSIKEYLSLDDNGNILRRFPPFTGIEYMEDNTSYIIHTHNYSLYSIYFGEPDYRSILNVIVGDALIDLYNIYFFANNAMPALIITTKGDKLNLDGKQDIQTFMRDNHKGIQNSSRTLVLHQSNTEGEINIITLGDKRDGSFLKLAELYMTKILAVHRVPPKMVGIASSGSLGSGSESMGAMKVFVESTLKNLQSKEELFWNRLLKDMFGVDPKLRFNTLDITDAKTDAIVAEIYKKNNVLNLDAIRVMNKLDGKMTKEETDLLNAYDSWERVKKVDRGDGLGGNIDDTNRDEGSDRFNDNEMISPTT